MLDLSFLYKEQKNFFIGKTGEPLDEPRESFS